MNGQPMRINGSWKWIAAVLGGVVVTMVGTAATIGVHRIPILETRFEAHQAEQMRNEERLKEDLDQINSKLDELLRSSKGGEM